VSRQPAPDDPHLTLDRLTAGRAAVVLDVTGPAAGEMLHEGIAPGALLSVESRTPLGGPLIVQVGRARVAIARPAAAGVRISVQDAPTA
jgi:Fe2+ transport system protein FeoA